MKTETIDKHNSLQNSSIDNYIVNLVQKAFLNVSEPLLEVVVDKIITRRLSDTSGESPIDIDEAATLIKKSKQTVYYYCSKNLIPFHKSESRNIFFRSELLLWLKGK